MSNGTLTAHDCHLTEPPTNTRNDHHEVEHEAERHAFHLPPFEPDKHLIEVVGYHVMVHRQRTASNAIESLNSPKMRVAPN